MTDNPEKQNDDLQMSDFVPSRPGRTVTTAGLVERIAEEFYVEYGDDVVTLRSDNEPLQRRTMLKSVTEYIFGVESVSLSIKEQAQVLQLAYSEIFGYGTLDRFFNDALVTTVTIEGAEKVSARYGAGAELTHIDEPVFESTHHLKRTLKRLLADAKAELTDATPIIEAGLSVEGRPISVSIIAPPIITELTADIRVHPTTAITLDNLIADNFISESIAQFLIALVKSEHGFVIVGDTESGKTTLLNALLNQVEDKRITTVERAGELRLGDNTQAFNVLWEYGEQEARNFAQCVESALESSPELVVLDEVRADEPQALLPLLFEDDVPRQIWSFRGGSMSKRIRSALGQVARMANPAQPELMVHRLYNRLPFVVIVKRRQGQMQLREIAQWQYPDEQSEYPDFVTLIEYRNDETTFTGKRPTLDLDLPDDFWG